METTRFEFTDDAYEAAARTFRSFAGWMVTVVPTHGEPFDALIGADVRWDYAENGDDPIRVGPETGNYEVMIGFVNAKHEPNGNIAWLDIYRDIERIVVL